jgi:hypothetical protein
MMTVGELRKRLAGYHEHLPVLVNGYEGGYDNFGFHLARVSALDWGGTHSYWGAFDDDDESGIEVLVLNRTKTEGPPQ